MSAIHLSNVTFSYSSSVPILSDVSFDLGPGWTGLVGVNGSGKSTVLSLIAGDLAPGTGTVSVEPAGLPPVLCVQRVDDLTREIDSFGLAWDRESVRMRATLDLDVDDLDRWDTMSPGERKRWQIGAALAQNPAVLLLDEPTNHLDGEARNLLIRALERFTGCGVIVSHDRSILNDLTTKTLRVVSGRVERWNGAYDIARSEWLARDAANVERFDRLKADQAKLARRLDEKRRMSAQKDAERLRERRSAGKHDLDTRGSAATYRHERGQKTGPQTVRSITNELDRLDRDLGEMRFDKELGGDIEFDFEPAPKEFLIRYEGSVDAGTRPLFPVDLAVRRSDRIRIAGPNGAGKTSLLRTLVDAATIPSDRILYLAQETTAEEAVAWLDEVRSLPRDDRGRVMSLVASLGADPGALLASELPSPGEARKVALALGLGTPNWLLVLDEPTNHLDLPSIERLEDALTHYEGALLLITHDDDLADATTATTWTVGPGGVV